MTSLNKQHQSSRQAAWWGQIARLLPQRSTSGLSAAPYFRSIPLFPIALSLIAGCFLAQVVSLSPLTWSVIALISLIMALKWDFMLLASMIALAGLLGPPLPVQRPNVALEEGWRGEFLAQVAEITDRRDYTEVYLKLLAGVPDSLGMRRVIWIDSDTHGYAPGDTLLLYCRLQQPRGRLNPNGFDYRRFLWTRGIQGQLRGYVEVMDRYPYQKHSLAAATLKARRFIGERFRSWVGAENSYLAGGLMLGLRGNIDPELRADFARAGAAHLLAVSGLHVGFVVLILVFLLDLFRVSGWLRITILGLILLAYALLTGAPPSVVRAAIMAVLVVGQRVIQRPVNRWNLLAATAVISILWHPETVYSVSFQLSFSAVAGILLLYEPVRSWIGSTRIGGRFLDWRPARYLLELMIVSLVAQLGTMPVMLNTFHELPVYGVLANIFVVPVAAWTVINLFLALLTELVWPGAAYLFGQSAWLGLELIQWLVTRFAALPGSTWITGHPALISQLLIAGTLLLLPGWFRGQRKLQRMAIFAVAMATLWTWDSALAARPLQVTFLDVGQGDAIHLSLPGGEQLLIDGGELRFGRDAGTRTVVPYLKGQGVRNLSAIIATHPHSDHFGGFRAVLSALSVGRIHGNHRIVDRFYTSMITFGAEQGVAYFPLEAGDRLEWGAVRMYVLAPDSATAVDLSSANNTSLVLKLVYGESTLLFMGDTERAGERRLLAYGEVLYSNWIKIGHHGSITGSGPALIAAVQPKGAVISAGRENQFGHPAQATLTRLDEAGVDVHRTALEGAIRIESDGHGWALVNWH